MVSMIGRMEPTRITKLTFPLIELEIMARDIKRDTFLYTRIANMGFVGDGPHVTAIFADCLEFN